jgi:hypothetical protein
MLYQQYLKNIFNDVKGGTILENINNVRIDYMDLMAIINDGLFLTNAVILKHNYDAIITLVIFDKKFILIVFVFFN